MNITELSMNFDETSSTAKIWVKLRTQEDCDAMISWIYMVRRNIRRWQKINEKALHTAKAPTAKNDAQKQGKVLSPT